MPLTTPVLEARGEQGINHYPDPGDCPMSRFQPCYALPGEPTDAVILPFLGETLLITPERQLPEGQALAVLGPPAHVLVIGELDGRPCELWQWPASTPWPEGLGKGDFRQLSSHWPQGPLEALARGKGLAAWLGQYRYCSVCATPLETSPREPARECPACGHKAYPRIAPVCIGLVRRGDTLLLARSPHFPPGIYSALAGYLEAGESVEACLRREIREESGIEITNLRWFGSQSWPYPNSLMLGFIADYAGGDLVPQAGEIEDIGWFPLDALPLLPHPSTIAAQMIAAVRRGEFSGKHAAER